MADNNTVFAQVLKLVPRHQFESLARKHKSGRMSRSMTRWNQFVAMGMAQLTGRCSLRDIVSNLAAQSSKLYHVGVGVVTRSSLARVNAEKPWELYEELHGRLLARCQAKAPGHSFRFKGKLFLLDSTTIDLCLSVFPWADFRRTKGAVKVHVGLDHEGYLPTFVRVTNGKTSDIEAARALTLPKGSIVAADRAYVDFAWIASLISGEIHLVTRLKRGIKYRVVETRECNAKRGVTSDETIEFTSAKGRKQCPHQLRRVGYHDRETKEGLRVPDDAVPSGREDHRGHLQVALAGGAVLQVDQAELEGEELRRDDAQRRDDPALDCAVHISDPVVHPVCESDRMEFERDSATSSAQPVRAPVASGAAGK